MFQMLLISLFYVIFYVNAQKVEVDIKQGKLVGTRRLTVYNGNMYYAFYGVPYAQPPIGKLRFKDPKAPKKWIKSYDASTEFHGACAQMHIIHKHGLYGHEDCLYLNIYTPQLKKNKSNLKAVMVWIHGYAFTSSFSHIHGPDFLIENDVVVITVTHRIGAFGFVKINATDSHANMGLKDIIMALKWIRKNVVMLNGDLNNVTVMGSGSAATFLALLSTTKYNYLFSKMILQSGGMFSPSLFQDYLLERNRLEDNLKKMGHKFITTAPTKAIAQVSSKIYASRELINTQKPLIPFLPVIEIESTKSLLTANPTEYLRYPNVHTKPILIGFNTQESISEVIPFLHNPHYLKSLATHFKYMIPFSEGCAYNYTTKIYENIGSKIKNEYFKGGISETSITNLLRYTSDLIKYPIYHFIRTYFENKINRIYFYKFNYAGTLNAVKATSINGGNFKVKGAASGDEICYIMKCEPLLENYISLKHNSNNRDRLFIQRMTNLWTNFAKSDEPTPNTYKENVTWPPVTLQDDNILLLGKAIHLVDSKQEKRMYTFWNEIYNKYYKRCIEHDEL